MLAFGSKKVLIHCGRQSHIYTLQKSVRAEEVIGCKHDNAGKLQIRKFR